MTNQVTTKENSTFKTGLAKVSDTFFPMITEQLTGNGIRMDDYQKTCVMNAIAAINTVLESKGLSWNDTNLDRNNITDILLKVAALKLNASANPREVYFQQRNVKVKVGKEDVWKKQVEMGIEGDGNDAILSNFGRGIQTVHQFWLVREGDEFTYPHYKGIEVIPPEWSPKGTGKVMRVVYPISKTDGQVDYHIAEREDVIRNLIAHAKNNMMNETFGIAKDRYNATADQKREIDAKKNEIISKIESLGLDAAFTDEGVAKYISPAWKDPQSRESMIVRKMRNNVVKKIPKDFGNAFISLTYNDATDEEYSRVRKEIKDNANQEFLDFEPTAEVQPESPTIEQAHEPNGNIQDAEFVEVQQKDEQPKYQEQHQASFTDGPGF